MSKFSFLKPGGGMPPMVASTVFIFLAVIGLYAAVQQGVIDLSDPVELSVEIGELPAGPLGDTVPVPLTVRLTNNQDEALALTAPDPCKVFRWLVLNPNKEFIQSKPPEPCASVVMQGRLDPRTYLEEDYTIDIDTRRVRPGFSYVLMVRYWGHETRVPLILAAPVS